VFCTLDAEWNVIITVYGFASFALEIIEKIVLFTSYSTLFVIDT